MNPMIKVLLEWNCIIVTISFYRQNEIEMRCGEVAWFVLEWDALPVSIKIN